MPDELERDFQERVCFFARIAGWKVYTIPDSRRASMAGYPDLTMWHVKQGRLLFVELKREKGKLSESQKVVLSDLEKLPCVEVYVWRPSQWDEITLLLTKKIIQNNPK